MVHADSMPYSPYGAFELKATYQRNIMVGILCATLIGLVIGITLWVIETPSEVVRVLPQPPTRDDGGPRPQRPPTITRGPAGNPQPNTAQHGFIPRAVEGNDLEEIDTSAIPSLHDYYYGDVLDTAGGLSMFIDTNVSEPLPEPDSFIVLEFQPEIVHRVQLEYPSMARRAGMSGTVTVQVLAGKSGEPLKAIIARSSGWQVLDEAALAGAFKNTYKRGIQNGMPVACRVSYRVDFSLEPDR
jgi:TonB family protein